MALVSRMVSDISGTEANESDFVKLVVRQHPSVDEPKSLDVLPAEIENLKEAGNLVVLEVGSNGDRRQVVMTHAEFKKLVKDDVVQSAAGTRGRRPGFRPAPKPKDDNADKSE